MFLHALKLAIGAIVNDTGIILINFSMAELSTHEDWNCLLSDVWR